MKRLILTNDTSAAGHLKVAGIGDYWIALDRQFVWGRAPSDVALVEFFGAGKKDGATPHWSDFLPRRILEAIGAAGATFTEFCSRFDAIELWMSPRPNDQLQLVCLLHYLRVHPEIASRLSLVQAHISIGNAGSEMLAEWKLPIVKITPDHFELASRAWRAFAASTPQDWFDLSAMDLILLPRLRHAVIAMLEELPWCRTGLGATEMRMLDFVWGAEKPRARKIMRREASNSANIFSYWELGALLDGLARRRNRLVSGLREGPFNMDLHDDPDRRDRYMKSKLALTPLGYAVLAQTDDFARHNPINRWWGGTKLTNKRLWRWDQDNKVLVAPK